MSTVRVAMRWPAWLVAAVDEVAGPRGRSSFAVAAVQQALVSYGNGKAPCAVVSPPEGLVSAAASPEEVRRRRIEDRVKGGAR